jgi:hypothetical protein
MAYDMDSIGHSIDKLEDTISDAVISKTHCRSSNMNDIAGLLALMQSNKGMDLPGLLALCQERGYGDMWGSNFMFIFFLFFLMGNGGWGGWGNRAAAEGIIGAENLNVITSLYDRISAAQAASDQGFSNLQTWLCQSISNVVSSVRDQGDRNYDATRNVGDAVKDCCCKMEAQLATLNCKVDGVSRDIRESTAILGGKIDLAQERNLNAMQAMECRLGGQIKDLSAQTALGFERQACLIRDLAKDQEMNELRKENANLKLAQSQQWQTNTILSQLKEFATTHYPPTTTTTTTTP